MTWRAAASLLVLHAQLKAGAPRAAPPATRVDEWGLVGDLAHTSASDHTPHDFAGWGTAIVTAADFPNRPDLGLDAHQVLDDIRRSRDPRAKYGISNGQIFSNHPADEHGHHYDAWQWRPYLNADGSKPSDGHYTHGHLSVVGAAVSDGTQPWQTIGAPAAAAGKDDEDMSFGPTPVLPAEEGPTSLCIPPVQGGIADPRRVWLNVGADLGNEAAALRIWASDGGGHWRAVDFGGSTGGLHALANGVVLSVELQRGDRILSVSRWPVDSAGAPLADEARKAGATGTISTRSISVCFERM